MNGLINMNFIRPIIIAGVAWGYCLIGVAHANPVDVRNQADFLIVDSDFDKTGVVTPHCNPSNDNCVLPKTASLPLALHVGFPEQPQDLIKIKTELTILKAVDTLSFFAVNVHFVTNKQRSFAHGGLQLVRGQHLLNWGGLVSHGGGNADYANVNTVDDLQIMQNGTENDRLPNYPWELGRTYAVTIERGRQVSFSPGSYVFIGKGAPVSISNDRVMWDWILTIRPVSGDGPIQVSHLYHVSDRINDFQIWNECGGGACDHGMAAKWAVPTYESLAHPNQMLRPTKVRYF
jgi:hypothetical protein